MKNNSTEKEELYEQGKIGCSLIIYLLLFLIFIVAIVSSIDYISINF